MVKEVAEMTGISVRTLHYYDEIGLLKPAFVGENGYRYYEEEQLLRLQQIMFFREFKIPLADIGRSLDNSSFDLLEALQAHHKRLSQEAARIDRLLQTLNYTIEKLKGEREMRDEELYDGFDMEKQKEYEREVKERWGENHPLVKESLHKTADWAKEDYDSAKRRMDDLHVRIKEAFLSGAPADSPKMQELMGEHYRNICYFYTPTKVAFQGLGEMYVDDPRFCQIYENLCEGLARYVCDAMNVYASRKL